MKVGLAEKILNFVAVHTSARLVKPTWPAEPVFLAPTLLMGALPATRYDKTKAKRRRFLFPRRYFLRQNHLYQLPAKSIQKLSLRF